MATVGRQAPDFAMDCTWGPESSPRRVARDLYAGRWLLLFFYPRDFSLICPTELTAISDRLAEFQERGCSVLGISTDSIESHERWIATPRSDGGLGEIGFPLGSDPDGTVSRAYGVYDDAQDAALRGLVIIDPDRIVQYLAVNNHSVGRRCDDVLRIVSALQTGGMCPPDWQEGDDPINPAEELGEGNVVGTYEIETEVGRGGFASVFRAYDATLDRHLAVKVYRPGAEFRSDDVLEEARAAAALNHPNVCTVYAVDRRDGIPVIAMEFVEGGSLETRIEEGPLGPDEALPILYQTARGMAAAHAEGIVHGDLKPANILLSRDGEAKIVDFGVAQRLEPVGPHAETVVLDDVRPERIAGTPCYMSPEQSTGEPLTPASDVFSLGAVIYETLTGEKAFPGEDLATILARLRRVDGSELARPLPDPFSSLVARALVPDASQRDLTMEEIAERLAPRSAGSGAETEIRQAPEGNAARSG